MVRRIDTLGRASRRFTWGDLANQVQQWHQLGWPLGTTTWGTDKAEPIENHFSGYINAAYKANGPVFATILARMLLFTEVRFKWRDRTTQDLFTSPALDLLEVPWPNGTTGDLLARMEQDASLAGNAYFTRRAAWTDDQTGVRHPQQLHRMRPDWVSIVVGSPSGDPDDLDSNPVGYLYHPRGDKTKSQVLLPEQVAHFAPIPDPDAQYRGMSWLTPVLTEIQADQMATKHKRKFFENAATPNVSVSMAKEIGPEAFERFVDKMEESHTGVDNAYRTLYAAGGADVKVIGADFKQLDFKSTQGTGETRIAAAGGVPAIIVGLSEGLDASTYSNYGQARRKFGDHWARPQWREAAGSLQTVVAARPDHAELWYDADGIAFLQEDQKDDAEIQAQRASTIRTYVEAGFTADSAVRAVTTGNLDLLEHTGLTSVQLQKPGTADPTTGDT